MVFEFTVNHPDHGDYYTGTIAASDAAKAKELLSARVERKNEVGVSSIPLAEVKVSVKEVKTNG